MTCKVLILFAHPALEKSRVNRRLAEAVRGLPEVTFHDLYEEYPEFAIDVHREQALLARELTAIALDPDMQVVMADVARRAVPAADIDAVCEELGLGRMTRARLARTATE